MASRHLAERSSRNSQRPVSLAILASAVFCFAIAPTLATIRLEIDFTEPTVSQKEDGSVFVAAPDCVTFNEPGLPMLPSRRVVVLLPPGETVTAVRVQTQRVHAIDGTHFVAPAQEPVPISLPGPHPLTEPDPTVYVSDATYPSAAARLVIEQKGWGHGLAFLRVFPVAYRPISGAITWFERVIVEVDTALPQGANARSIPRFRNSARAVERLSSLVVNPEDLALYEATVAAPLAVSPIDTDDSYPYVIITGEEFKEAFQPVADFQSSRGLRARIVTVEEIAENYPEGRDVTESIRLFLVDAYESWGVDYALLGGDAEIIEPRMLRAEWPDIPADCYFEGLDGDWRWPGDEDLVGEIAVGRASVSNVTEIASWHHKNVLYSEHPVVSQVNKALFLGEQLDAQTWADDFMEDIRYGADTCGFSTVGYPSHYDRPTLYDRDGVWDKYDLIPLLNEGFPAVHHLGHSDPLFNMRLEPADLAYLTNDGVNASYPLHYTQGCNAGAFDKEDSCICEAFVNGAHGAAAAVCNSRWGLYFPGTTCGPSQYFHRQFADARYGEEIVTAGRMNVDSKADLAWMADLLMLAIHFGLNLLGDPALPVWGDILGELVLEHADRYVIGQGDYEVTVTANQAPVPGATVTMYSADFSVWASGVTNDSGSVLLSPNVKKMATLYLKAIHPDFLPVNDDLLARRK